MVWSDQESICSELWRLAEEKLRFDLASVRKISYRRPSEEESVQKGSAQHNSVIPTSQRTTNMLPSTAPLYPYTISDAMDVEPDAMDVENEVMEIDAVPPTTWW